LYQLEAGRGAIQTQQAGIFGQQAASAFGGAASALIGGISDGDFDDVLGNFTERGKITNQLNAIESTLVDIEEEEETVQDIPGLKM
jgi:hypothetical protein